MQSLGLTVPSRPLEALTQLEFLSKLPYPSQQLAPLLGPNLAISCSSDPLVLPWPSAHTLSLVTPPHSSFPNY